VLFRSFTVDGRDLDTDRQTLVFEGLDTYATVYVNGKRLAEFSNMLVEHGADVTGRLNQGENTLVVEFHVLSERAKKDLPEGFWINYSTERAYARKAGYSFGWDWAPRIATVGIWKPVALLEYEDARLVCVQIKTSYIDTEKSIAELQVNARTENFTGGRLSYRMFLTDEDGNCRQVEAESGSFSIYLEDARFWWTADLGRPHLYHVVFELLSDGRVADSYVCSYGIRTLEVRQKAADSTNRFIFVLNGIEIFARGASWVPVSSFPAAAGDDVYLRLLTMARDAGMNMLCLWGGGIYEKDIFYNTCDRLGILIWQYFMFACGEYPDFDPEFMASVQDEIEKVVLRLRNHPSIAIWVGNVEGPMISEKIGLNRAMYGKELFETAIPEWLGRLDDTRFYMPSSPYYGETANSMEAGDRHNWDVWFSDIPYTDYRKDSAAFASEYGIHASPARATVEKYLGCADPDIDSHMFKYLNKDQSLDRMNFYMKAHARLPRNLEEYIDYSMLVQAEGLKFGTEHYRRNFPKTGGALIWQLNDCCPAHSWSMIDADLIPKASYYYSKRFFAPLLVSLEEIDATTTGIWVINNRLTGYKGRVTICVRDFFGNEYFREHMEVSVSANTSVRIKDIVVGGRFYPNVIIPDRHRNFYVCAQCEANRLPAIRFFGEYSDVPLPRAKLKVGCSGSDISISATNFARFVKIDGELEGLELSDNYFNLQSGDTHTVSAKVITGKPLGERYLFVKALNSDINPIGQMPD
jgi:beta-mannosidase